MLKYFQVIKKILHGQDVTKVRFSKEEWDEQFKKGKWDFLLQVHPNIVAVAALVKGAVLERGKICVLDIGCGNGALARELTDASISYVGTDISQTALDRAREVAPYGTYVQATMDQDPDLEGRYDLIIFSEVLLYGDYERVLLIHKKYLKPDGRIIVSLYDTWRTKLIWKNIKKQIEIDTELGIKDKVKKVTWNVCAAKYR